MSSFWTAIVILFLIFSIASVISRYLEMRKSENFNQVDELKERLDTLEADLSKRIATLERIVTDNEQQLKRELAELAD
ncbi:MAG: hypothetical protein DHS20C11_07760 [Lysobacteraceae bacterium]|nr:MAG: hypothetical protein DHS20C11_07760 [Xanthomonadaceae bacterium]